MVQIRRKGPKRSEHVGMQKGANFTIVSTKVLIGLNIKFYEIFAKQHVCRLLDKVGTSCMGTFIVPILPTLLIPSLFLGTSCMGTYILYRFLLDNRYPLFGMGKISILLVACLSIESWYCVLKPTQYRQQFSRKRIIIYVFMSFVAICILSMNKFFNNSLAGNKCASQKAPHGSNGTRAFVFA